MRGEREQAQEKSPPLPSFNLGIKFVYKIYIQTEVLLRASSKLKTISQLKVLFYKKRTWIGTHYEYLSESSNSISAAWLPHR